jgi:hypothetical protein
MSIYYLLDVEQMYFYTNSVFESLDEAVKKAKMLTKANPTRRITIVKSMGVITYVTKTTGEHEEIFFN